MAAAMKASRYHSQDDSTPTDVGQAVQWLVEGTLPAERLVSHVLELSAVAQAFELMQSGEALRVVLKP